ncbi:hypothetical protein, partial [Lishizhenia sp.]|uniref:hypothetical protein n=1 Tax=Lishizhenia sp. TaxID=2497594 RepID=UPI00299D2036
QKQHYPFVGQNNDWEMQLPNFPNDSGSVFLIDTQDVYDVFNYSEKMHFNYLEDVNGVALERINLQGKTGKWYSAGSNVNYGTPGFKNSQITQGGPSSKLSISPKIFTPNGDGEKDLTSIYYSHNGNKYMLSMKIYSEEGMVVKSLFNNVLQGFSGVVLWDGMDEENHICNIGNYIIVAEFLDLESQQLQVCRQILILNGN